jgi:DNA-binding IclR family transcriptional regulator
MDKQLTDWLRLVQAEYQEMPGLNLTTPQVQRLWGFDAVTCKEVLGTLEAERFLKRTPHDRYVLARERF